MINSYLSKNNEFRDDLIFYICDYCFKHQSFNNSNEFREHVLKYHDVDTKFNIFKMQLRDTNHVHHVEKHVYNYVSINSFDYIIVQINVFDLKLSFCIDFDKIINLLNKIVLFRNNLYNIIHNAFSITIIDVIERQIINQMIKLDVELNFNKISLIITIYLMKNLFSKLIIINDVLNRFDVNFQHDNNIIKIEIQEMSLFYNNVDFTLYYYIIISMRFDQHINKIIKK